jgi:tripartite-type tricarboxylate transporter receptor subunit TctC
MAAGKGFSRRSLMGASVAALMTTLAPMARGQSWPTKPIRLVTGFPPGSATDGIARVLAEQIRIKLGQPVVVENRPGANGALGAAEVARSASDGYTLLVTNSSSITVNPQVYKKLGYLPERDFTPVSMVVSAPFIMTINPANERLAGVNTVADLVALAKRKPGEITYGSGGPGNLAHLGFERSECATRCDRQGNRCAARYTQYCAQREVGQAQGACGLDRGALARSA